MSASATHTSSFLPDALTAIGAGRMVIVDGPIDDDVLLYSEPATLTEALARGWRDATSAIAVAWKPGTGLDATAPEDRERLVALLHAHPRGDADLADVAGDDPLAPVDPSGIAALLVRLLEQDATRILVVIEHADLICAGGVDHLSRQAVAALLRVVEAFEQTSELHGLVLLARDLGALTPALQQRAGAAQLRIAAKTLDERLIVAAQAFDRPASDPAIERLAIASDGFGLREIAMLPAHAYTSRLSLDSPRELTASFRHGHRTDPWVSLTPARVDEVREQVRRQVFGQARAVGEVLDRLDVARSGLELDLPSSGARKSRMELFLVGPTGVGKNELARALARAIFGDASAVLTFDMSAFQQEHSGEQLFGAPPGYVGHERGSPLVDRLRERPFSVIVFDEIEKAHENNWLRLMAAIDEGRVTDTRQVQASLEHAIVIFTSNIGGDVLLEEAERRTLTTEAVEQMTLGLVRAHLSRPNYELPSGEVRRGLGKPEVWGRLSGSIVPFDLLRPEVVARIVERLCNTLMASARRGHGLDLVVDVGSVAHTVTDRLGAPGTWNGRLIKGHVDALLRRPLARALTDDRKLASATSLQASLDVAGALRLVPR